MTAVNCKFSQLAVEVRGTLQKMDVKLILVGLTVIFTIACLFFGTKNGFYDSDNYHGNGSAH